MRLTEAHVARLRREIPDPGPQLLPGYRVATEEDHRAMTAAILAGAPADDFWVFAYGSLIWKPAFEFVESRVATVHGWRRIFCLGWDYRFRGNREAPGLMLALDRGGSCTGVAFRLSPAQLEENLLALVKRETSTIPSSFPARWVRAVSGGRSLRALTFAINRASGRYVVGLSDDEVAAMLASAVGFRGSMAEYLHATVAHLESLGIHDRHLWRLQELVAARIEAAHP